MNPSRLYRFAASCGLACALILILNATRRTGVVPTDAVTHAIAPLAETFGLLALMGLYLLHRDSGRTGLVAFTLNFIGLCGVLGAEFVINLIFPVLTTEQTHDFLHGLTGKVFTVASLIFLLGSALFGAVLWRAELLPRAATAAYVVGSVLIGLRGVLPSAVFIVGLYVAAAGIGVLSLALSRQGQAVGAQSMSGATALSH